MTTTENVYDKAREVLRERGWRQSSIGAIGHPTCLVGALGQAAGCSSVRRWDESHGGGM